MPANTHNIVVESGVNGATRTFTRTFHNPTEALAYVDRVNAKPGYWAQTIHYETC